MKWRSMRNGIVAAASVVILVAVIAAAALIGMNLNHRHQVDRADHAAALYNGAEVQYRAAVKQILDQIDANDPKAGLRLLNGAIPKSPKLIKLSGYGPAHSPTYQQAAGQEPPDLTAIGLALKEVQVTKSWALTANKVLVSVDSYGVSGPQFNGANIRGQVLVPMSKRFTAYKLVAVPAGSESLDQQIRSEVASVLEQVKDGAVQLDAGRSAPSFTYGFPRLKVLVGQELARARALVKTAVNAAVGPGRSAGSTGDSSI